MFGQKNIPSVVGKMNTGKRVLRGPAEIKQPASIQEIQGSTSTLVPKFYTQKVFIAVPLLHVSLVLSC